MVEIIELDSREQQSGAQGFNSNHSGGCLDRNRIFEPDQDKTHLAFRTGLHVFVDLDEGAA